MARPQKEAYELADTEKRDLIQLIQQGQLVKVSKDKQGVVTRERLTRHWTDWVDYWAVDFDYMSRKEIIKVARDMGLEGHLPGIDPVQGNLVEFEER